MNNRLNESGWLSSHPELKGGSELDQLQAALSDAMTCIDHHTTDLYERLKRSERLAVIGRMAAVLAHEIRNPLHIVRGTAETICRRSPDMGEFTTDINEEVDRVERLIGELLEYTRQTPPQLEEIDAPHLLDRVLERFTKSLPLSEQEAQSASIGVNSSNVTLKADPVMIEQALSNLVQNAVEASAPDQPIDMTVRQGEDDEVIFEVLDRGTGIEAEGLEKVLDPFFSTKATGTGLGLAIVDKIASLHGGSISVGPRVGGGTQAVLIIPKGQDHE
jgi:signal transduction histidine kinase